MDLGDKYEELMERHKKDIKNGRCHDYAAIIAVELHELNKNFKELLEKRTGQDEEV